MKRYPQKNLRNVCLLGHGSNGKTSLAEAMLYLSKAVDRLGKVADGNTVCDFDAEEIKRKVSISTAVAPFEWRDCKINIIDTRYFDFVSEAIRKKPRRQLCAVVSGKPETEVGARRPSSWPPSAACPVILHKPHGRGERRLRQFCPALSSPSTCRLPGDPIKEGAR